MIPAFKEWQIVCSALAEGQQSIILRKGGIAEGKGGFVFNHREFVLFPTRFHDQAANVRIPCPALEPEWQIGDRVTITHAAKLMGVAPLTKLEQIEALAPLHIWTEECLQKRYDYNKAGLKAGSIQAALLRIYRLQEPCVIEYAKQHTGCKSWIELDLAPSVLENATPVLSDEQFDAIEQLWMKMTLPY